MSIKDMLNIKSKSEEMLDAPHNHLKYKLTVTSESEEQVREIELLVPTDVHFKEKEETLKALLTMFNKVKAEPVRTVPKHVFMKGELV